VRLIRMAPMGMPVAGESRPHACIRAPWIADFRNGFGCDLGSVNYQEHVDLTAKSSRRLKEWLL